MTPLLQGLATRPPQHQAICLRMLLAALETFPHTWSYPGAPGGSQPQGGDQEQVSGGGPPAGDHTVQAALARWIQLY